MPASRRALPWLTASRALAAAVVFGSHLVERLPWSPFTSAVPAVPDLASEAVGYFFVLSGFVLSLGARSRPTNPEWWRRRAARLVPVYAVTGLASVALLVLRGTPPGAADLVTYATFTQAWWAATTFAVNPPAWSVSCEVFFYATFPVVVVVVLRWLDTPRRRALAVVALLLAHLVATQTASGQWPPARLPDFVLGVVVGAAFAQRPEPRVGLAVAIPVAALALVASVADAGGLGSTLVLAASALLVHELAAHDRGGRRRPPASLVVLGCWSYAFYLVHYLVLRVLMDLTAHLVGDGPWPLAGTAALGATAFVGSWAVAGLLHRLVEQPAERRWRHGPPRAELAAIDRNRDGGRFRP